MRDHHRIHFFSIGLVASFASFALALAVLPVAMRTEQKVHVAAMDAAVSPALLYQVSGGEVFRRQFAISTERAIVVDLELMTLDLVDGGTVVKRIPVLSKGRQGTFWETPAGRYEVKQKIPNHFSSIDHVWMPYSMQFYGNFFIHGWPYYRDGTPVPPGYSGGCIRLSTEDAKMVYEFASLGTPIFITGAPAMVEATSTFAYYLRDPKIPPELGASGLIVADLETGQVLWERRGSEPLPAYGLASLMTALTAIETVNQYKVVRMSELLLGKPIPRRVEKGFLDEVPVGALIYPLLFSANDTAAMAFAEDRGERRFVADMNEKARAIGMHNTRFASATASVENLASPRDVFVLLRYLRESKPFVLDATLREEHVVHETNGKERFVWSNKNPWRSETGLYRGGILPETTDARTSAAAIWNMPISEFGERPIAIVVMDSPSPKEDIDAVRTYVDGAFIYAPVFESAPLVIEKTDPTPSLWSRIKEIKFISSLLSG